MSSELDGLCCPLTLEVFEDPCTLVGDGHTYERSSIQAWLDSGKLTSPTTGATLGIGGTRLVPNYAVKRTIAELAACLPWLLPTREAHACVEPTEPTAL